MRVKGVLFIHGLMGSPREFDPVESVVRRHGHRTRVVTLPGHGMNPTKQFKDTSAEELLSHCMAEYAALAREADEIYIVGHSLGGICTLLTAAEMPAKLNGIVVLSAPYEHAYFFNYLQGLMRLPLPHLIQGIRYAPECRTGFERPYYRPWMFPRLLSETRTMFRLMKERLPHINVPVCLAHSVYDLTIPYQEMYKIADSVGNPELVMTYTLEKCGHQIFPNTRAYDDAVRIILDMVHDRSHTRIEILSTAGESIAS